MIADNISVFVIAVYTSLQCYEISLNIVELRASVGAEVLQEAERGQTERGLWFLFAISFCVLLLL